MPRKDWFAWPGPHCAIKSRKRWVGRREKFFRVRGGPLELVLHYRPWKGICLVQTTRLIDTRSGASGLLFTSEFPDMKRRSASPSPGDGGRHLAAVESAIFHQLLALVEHCAIRQYDDGTPRETGYFTVRTSGAAWMLNVKDPDTATSFTSVASCLDKCVETANLLLACEEAPWEPDVWLLKNKPKPKK